MVVYTGLALFAGAGGLELGLKLALGDRYKCVAYVERSIEAASVLATNMERPEAGLDKGVIWDDVTTFTGDVVSPFVDNIDIISAGFPCQPWSVAGRKLGVEDERWLWPHIFRLVREIRPRNIFLENVTGLLHGGIEHVLGDLASVGFDAQWISLRASSVSAPHRRERVFILGNSRGTRSQIGEVHAGPVTGQGSAPVANTGSVLGQDPQPGRTQGRESSDASGASGALGITSSSGRSTGRHREREHEVRDNRDRSPSEDQQLRGVGQSGAGEGSEALVNPVGKRGRGWHTSGEYAEHAFPPGPSASAEWRDILSQRPDLAPAVESEVRGVVDGVSRGLARSQQLRILGNSVVAKQAALAFQILKDRIDGSTTTSK